MDNNIDLFFSFGRFKVPEGILRPSPQGRGFKSVLAQGPLGLVYEVHGVLSNSSRLSTAEGQPRARAITCNVLGVFYTTLININRGILIWS